MTEHFVTTLGEICEFRYGKPLPAETRRGGHVAVFGSNGVVGHHDVALVSGPSIIVGRKGSSGEVHYSPTDSWPIDTTYFVDSTATKTDLKWLSYALKASRLKELSQAAAVPGLNRNDAYRLPIILPPLDEQRRIAAILDKADALSQKRKRTIALLDSLTQSIFLEIFGDRDRWAESPLSDVVAPGTIVTYGIVQAGEEFPDGVPYIRTGDIQNGRIGKGNLRHTDPAIAAKFERSRVRAGEIVMSIRATVGTVALVPDELDGANLTQGTARISPGPQTNAAYLLHYLRSESVQSWIKRQVKGATFLEITLGRLRDLSVALPPLDLQNTFASLMSRVEEQMLSTQNSAEKADLLFLSLQHRAFSGQL